MLVLVVGAHGRVGSRVVALLLGRGHGVRCLVRTDGQAAALRDIGAHAIVSDLRSDIEWTAEGCEATVFAAGARHRGDLGAVDAGGAAKIAEAAYRYEHSRFVLCSAVGADRHAQASGGAAEFLAAKDHAERRLAQLDMPWTILRFGRLTETPGNGHIETHPIPGVPLTLSRDDAALAVAEALVRPQLARRAVPILDGDRHVAGALDAIAPRQSPATDGGTALSQAQSDNPPDDPDMIEPDAPPLDADVDWEGDGPVAPVPRGNEDPAPGMP